MEEVAARDGDHPYQGISAQSLPLQDNTLVHQREQAEAAGFDRRSVLKAGFACGAQLLDRCH